MHEQIFQKVNRVCSDLVLTYIRHIDNFIEKHSTVFSTEAPVEAMNTDLFHTGFTGAVVEGPFHLWLGGAVLHTGFFQPVLVVQKFVHELLNLKITTPLSKTSQ